MTERRLWKHKPLARRAKPMSAFHNIAERAGGRGKEEEEAALTRNSTLIWLPPYPSFSSYIGGSVQPIGVHRHTGLRKPMQRE